MKCKLRLTSALVSGGGESVIVANELKRAMICIGTASVVLASGCAFNQQSGRPGFSPAVKTQFESIFNNPDPCSNNGRNIGMAVGAVVGGVVGYLRKGKKGALVGAAVGTGGGALIGYSLDQRRCNLYKIAQANHLKIASARITAKKLKLTPSEKQAGKDSDVGLDVQIQNQEGEFVPGTAHLTPKARKYISSIAEQYVPNRKSGTSSTSQDAKIHDRKVLIVAHADESHDARKSAKLTEQRARAVAKVFREAGVPAHNIYFQGAGSTLPIASNDNRQGRTENNRIQIVDLPNETDLRRYLQLRQPNGRYFSTAVKRRVNIDASPSRKIVKRSRKQKYQGYDFGGTPLAQAAGKPIDLGNPVVHSSFSIISEAHADEPLLVNSCIDDAPHLASPVRNLETDHELPIRDYMPGFFGAPWLGGFHGNLVVVDKAYVPRDSGSPTPHPKLVIYKNYKGNVKTNPSYVAHVPVNVYRGDKATLYRMFVDGPLECIDFVKPNRPGNADARLYYARNGHTYLASGAFALKK